MSLELARFGVRSVVVERHPTTTQHPKTRNFNVRSMEIVRSWGAGVREELVAVALPREWNAQIVYTESLAGRELGRMPTRGFLGAGEAITPESPVLNAQDVFEPILRRGAGRTGLADTRYGQEVTHLFVDSAGVTATIAPLDGRELYTLRAEYAVAADGASSRTRDLVGAVMEGPRGLGYNVNAYFRADLTPWVAHRPAILYFYVNDAARGVFQPLDDSGRWLTQIAYDGTPENAEEYSAARCRQWIRAGVGSEVDVEILSIGTWTMNACVANRLVWGRIILVGDAAHQMPPTGGFGVNTGFVGVHNLGWKLAMVLRGEAGPGLLDTYDVEHRRVARYNADRSLDNFRMLARINAAALGFGDLSPAEAVAASRRYGNFAGMELGHVYESLAVVPDGTSPPPVDDEVIDYVPAARPGHRAPHLWIDRERSTIDLIGTGMTLLCGSGGDVWLEAALHEGISAHVVSATDFADLYGLEADGAVMVRPDGHVAYRSASAVDDPGGTLRRVLDRVLARA